MRHYIGMNHTRQQSTQFQMLNEQQCNTIYEAALRILHQTGCIVNNPTALSIFHDIGAAVEDNHVWIPCNIVEKALQKIPKQITLFDTMGNPKIHLSARNGNSYWSPGAMNQYIIDRHTSGKRITTQKDAYEAGLLCEALPNIDLASGLCYIGDCDNSRSDLYETSILLKTCSKPQLFWQLNKANLKKQIEMFSAISGSLKKFQVKPFAITSVSPSTPLAHGHDMLERAMEQWKNRIPAIYAATAIMGVSTPAHIASSFAISLADIFVGLILSQEVNPGTPFIGGMSPSPFDLENMCPSLSQPENCISAAGAADIFRFLNIPFVTFLGGSDAPTFDQQAAADITQQIMTGTISGCNLSVFTCYLESAVSGSLESLVFCDEIIESSRQFTKGIEISPETLDEEIIAKIGPMGNFLNEQSSFKNMSLRWRTSIYSHSSHEKWRKDGGKDLRTRCIEKTDEIINQGNHLNLDPKLLKELDDIQNS